LLKRVIRLSLFGIQKKIAFEMCTPDQVYCESPGIYGLPSHVAGAAHGISPSSSEVEAQPAIDIITVANNASRHAATINLVNHSLYGEVLLIED
jgi:hypothetical protein